MRQLVVLLVIALAVFYNGDAGAKQTAIPFDQKEAVALGADESALNIAKNRAGEIDRVAALIAGGDYLQALAADVTEDNAGNGTDGVDETPDDPDDGGWDWRLNADTDPMAHSTTASPPNIYGATGMGLYFAYLETGDSGYFTAMTDAAVVMAANSGIRSASDLIFLMNYNSLPGVTGTTYQDAAKAKFDGRIASYGGTATAFAEYIRDARHGQGYDNGIIAWDIGLWAVAADMLDNLYPGDPYDYQQAGEDIAEVIWQDSHNDSPGYFDLEECKAAEHGTARSYWFNLGVTGLIDAFIVTGNHSDEVVDLVDLLLESQYQGGAVTYYYGGDVVDPQSTAYGAVSLGRVDQATYQSEINGMIYWLASIQHSSGGYVYDSGNHYPEECGEATAAAYLSSPSVVGPDLTGYDCLSVTNTCLADIPIKIAREDDVEMRGFNVTFSLVDLAFCDIPNLSITQGTYLSDVAGTQYYVIDNLDGSYTVSCVILGGSVGATGDGTLFNIDVQRDTIDGTGYIRIDEVTLRDLNNSPILSGASADGEVTIDTEPPIAIANLVATQLLTGNDADGTTKITVTFSLPPTADTIEIYRAPYGTGDLTGAYPEYDDIVGAAAPVVPATYPPATPWALTSLTGSSEQDEPADRGYWYYIAYTWDECGNLSLISNASNGALNYHLGDTVPAAVPGDNDVATADITVLSVAWGFFDGEAGYNANCDIGPTANYSPLTLPTTDNAINFEDLMVFGMNFGEVRKAGGPIASAHTLHSEQPRLVVSYDRTAWESEEILIAHLRLQNDAGWVKGVQADFSYDPASLELITTAPGELLDNQSALTFCDKIVSADGVTIAAAALGTDALFVGSGELATVRFRVLRSGATAALVNVKLRDLKNRELTVDTTSLEADRFTLQPAHNDRTLGLQVSALPNPFRVDTRINFRTSEDLPVSVRIFDASGRLIRSLVDRHYPAGDHSISWDGRLDSGQPAGPGLYLYTLKAGSQVRSEKLFRVR